MIEQLELDQVIGQRNQFRPERYKYISESLFFENYELIEQTANLIKQQQEREKKDPWLDKNDHFMIFAMNILKQQTFSQYERFKSDSFKQYRQSNQASAVITTLNKLIKDNIDHAAKSVKPQDNDGSQKQQQQQKKEENNIIIVELEQAEIKDLRNGKLLREDLEKLLNEKIQKNLDFWDNQDTLKQVYQKEINNLNQNIQNDETLVYVTRKQIQHNDIRSHFEQNFIIKVITVNEKQTGTKTKTEELYQDITNSTSEQFKPLIIFNELFKVQVISPILELQELNKSVNFQDIIKKLGENLKKLGENQPIEIFLKLIETFDNCKQIIRWVNLLEKYLQEKTLSPQVNQNQSEKIKAVKSYLDQCYKLQDKRFQDKFYDSAQDESIDQFQFFKDQIEKNQQIQNQEQQQGNLFSFSLVLYEINQYFLTLYQQFQLGQESFYVLAKLDFLSQTTNKETAQTSSSVIDQMSLLHKEEGNTVYIIKFQLQEENQQLIKNEQYRDLIMEILMKCMAFKVKQTMYNPTTRKLSIKVTLYI